MKNRSAECLWLNKQLPLQNLVKITWGNASINLSEDEFLIKPSGVDYEELKEENLSLISKKDGSLISGKKQSVDTPFHLEIYKEFPEVYGIIHTHSKFATVWAQANLPIPMYGTTHADYFPCEIPICRQLTSDELNFYEKNIGKAVVEWYKNNKTTPLKIKSILIPFHGVLCFGLSAKDVLETAIVVEEIAEMSLYNSMFGVIIQNEQDQKNLFNFHYERKNGKNKYYGQ